MPGLIIPEACPPQLAPAIKDKIVDDIFVHGLRAVWDRAVLDFGTRQPLLSTYLKLFKILDQDGVPLADDRPRRVVVAAAVITELAYLQSGYDVPMDDLGTFANANMEARAAGITDAYIVASHADKTLGELLEIMAETPNMSEGADQCGGNELYVRIGGGCTRHFLQHGIAA